MDTKVLARTRRHRRVREKICGTPDRLRLSVYRSLKHIYAQMVDDLSGRTLVAASSVGLKEGLKMSKTKVAKAVGAQIAALAKAKNIERAVFDRGGYLYHGRIKALADAAREGGLLF